MFPLTVLVVREPREFTNKIRPLHVVCPNVFRGLSVVIALLSIGVVPIRSHTQQEIHMNIDLNTARQEIYDQVESWIKTAQAKLQTLEGQAEGKMAKAEVEAWKTSC